MFACSRKVIATLSSSENTNVQQIRDNNITFTLHSNYRHTLYRQYVAANSRSTSYSIIFMLGPGNVVSMQH